MFGAGLLDQDVRAGRLMTASSPIGAMVSSVMYRARWTAHSSFCSSSKAPTSRTMASSFGKMPTTSVRRLISPFRDFPGGRSPSSCSRQSPALDQPGHLRDHGRHQKLHHLMRHNPSTKAAHRPRKRPSLASEPTAAPLGKGFHEYRRPTALTIAFGTPFCYACLGCNVVVRGNES